MRNENEYTEQLKAQIARIDRLSETTDDTAFTQEVLGLCSDLSHSQTFQASWSTIRSSRPALRSTRAAPSSHRSSTSALTVTGATPRWVEEIEVDQGNGLWRAMQAWLDDMRTSWAED